MLFGSHVTSKSILSTVCIDLKVVRVGFQPTKTLKFILVFQGVFVDFSLNNSYHSNILNFLLVVQSSKVIQFQFNEASISYKFQATGFQNSSLT
jgi:hypothetical protein